jgi:predicted aspartyl protease
MSRAFTVLYGGLSRQLKTKVRVVPHTSQDKGLLSVDWEALWDTGATNTVVSQKIVDDLGLPPISYCTAATPQGTYDAACYYVDVYLPNKVVIPKLQVMGGKLTGFDVLIGMDIISLGDFAVTSHDNKTMFSFRCPSIAHLDFTKHSYLEPTIKTGMQTGRNSPCPCGSGKKHKNCCGKA